MGAILKERLSSILNLYNEKLPEIIRVEDFLLSKTQKCNLIIGNPPYVRHENIPETQKELYKERFSTFRHRSDLFIAFYEKGLRLLEEGGILSFICSNRWLKNQYGQGLRSLIQRQFRLSEIIDLEGTCPFEEEVIAYPAITTIKNCQKSPEANYYKINDVADLAFIDKKIRSSRTLHNLNSNNWFSLDSRGENYEKYLASIESQGFKIGIGVATGSDKVFLRDDFMSLVEPELLLPILTSKDLKNNKLEWSGNYIINPYNSAGGLIDLTKYPKAKIYFESQREILEKRHVAKKSPQHWYKTIDRIKPSILMQKKILLPDISGNSHLFIDGGNFYPHHNLYYIAGRKYDELVILASILESKFIRDQLMELGTTMNGGYPRWQSQNLKKLKVPRIDAIPKETADELIRAYHERDYETINILISQKHIEKYNLRPAQMTLFEPSDEPYGKG